MIGISRTGSQRIDIVEFINHLASRKATAVTRKRKLAAIRGFLKFLKDNQIIYGNPADTIEGPIREERDPAILLKTEYKALLQVAGGNTRDLAIVMLFLQTGLRVSELVNLKLSDIDFTSREITVRQGKGRKDRVVPLVKQAEAALKAYLKVRDAQPEYDEVFIARNGTSMDQRTVRYRIQKYYKEAGIKKKASVHTLRHTFSTHQIHNGLKINQLKEVLGHRRMETTYKYVHLDRNESAGGDGAGGVIGKCIFEKNLLSLFQRHVEHSTTTLLCISLPAKSQKRRIISSDNHLLFHYPLPTSPRQ